MIALAIEHSGPEGSVALVEDGRVLVNEHFHGERGRGSSIHGTLSRIVMSQTQIDVVVVGTGPGSYNALRSSIAAAWGIARAKDIPLHGVCSLLGFPGSEYSVVGDARSGQWFFATIVGGTLAHGPVLIPSGSHLEDTPDPIYSAVPIAGLDRAINAPPEAALLTSRALGTPGLPEPVYLKPPHITSPRPPAV